MAKRRNSRLTAILLTCVLFAFIAVISIFFISKQVPAIGNLVDLDNWISKMTDAGNQLAGKPTEELSTKYKFALIADSHEDLSVYPEIVADIAARQDLVFVAHLGDLSNAGESQKLQESKQILDTINAPVHVLPGDHDSNWVPRRDLTNFKQVFGLQRTSFSVTHDTEKFIFIDNSDGNEGISLESWEWLSHELEISKNHNIYVLMSTPLSNPYLTFKTMGSQSESVKKQAEELGNLLLNYKVKAIFAGDTHTFSQYKDKSTEIPIITVGATGVNKNPLPLYTVVEILSDGSYNVSSIPLNKNDQ